MKETTVMLKEVLSKGLSLNNNPRNNPMLVESIGAFVHEKALQSVGQFTIMSLPAGITFVFPYPQLKVLSDLILLCNDNQIWEWNGSVWVSKISGLSVGTTWTHVDRKQYVILSNMRVTVERSPVTLAYSVNGDLPFGSYGDYNGQLSVGSANGVAVGDI